MYKKADSELDFMEVEESGHLKTALDALRQLIVEKLDSDKRTRFSSVANLCEVAKSLMRAEAKPRVPKKGSEYFGPNVFDEGDEGIGYMNGVAGGMMIDGNLDIGEPMRYMTQDPRQQRRNMRVQRDSLSQMAIESQRAQLAAAEARELKDLLAVRGLIGSNDRKGILSARVDKLFHSLEERNQNVDLVPPELPRGSATGSNQPDGDGTPHVQPIERGADSDGSLSEEGSEGREDLQAVGNS